MNKGQEVILAAENPVIPEDPHLQMQEDQVMAETVVATLVAAVTIQEVVVATLVTDQVVAAEMTGAEVGVKVEMKVVKIGMNS